MRPALITGFLAVLVGLLVWAASGGGGGAPPPGPAGAPAGTPVAPAVDAADATDAVGAPRAVPTGAVAHGLRQPDGLAAEPTACLRVVDAGSGEPVAGAAIYRMRAAADEAALAYTGSDGLAPLPLAQSGQLVVARADYLLRMAPTRLGSTPEAPQVVQLRRDAFTHRRSFRFRRPDGSTPDEVCVQLRPLREDRADQPMPETVRTGGDEVQRAWREQMTLAAVRPLPELHVQLGFANAAFVHLLAGDDDVVFVETGAFALEAATTDGFVARETVQTGQGGGGARTIQLQPGGAIVGTVRDANGAAVADGFVTIAGGDPLRLVGRTGADGRFSIGPLVPGEHRLEVRHREHRTAQPGPFAVAAGALADAGVLTLDPLPLGTLRGRVIAAGTREPLASASASVVDATGQVTKVDADADGWFALPLPGAEAVRLNVGADACLVRSELVTPGTGPLEFELWPASAELRRERGLTGSLSGVVVDAGGRGIAGIGVRFAPDGSAAPADPGRRVLSGDGRSLPLAVTTGSDGAFLLEALAGSGLLAAIDGAPPDERGQRVTVEAGRITGGLRLEARRR
ncbi:MAG: carboxypeptidase regulatory-like domain-containing protein [Planctomycetota bacterium]